MNSKRKMMKRTCKMTTALAAGFGRAAVTNAAEQMAIMAFKLVPRNTTFTHSVENSTEGREND